MYASLSKFVHQLAFIHTAAYAHSYANLRPLLRPLTDVLTPSYARAYAYLRPLLRSFTYILMHELMQDLTDFDKFLCKRSANFQLSSEVHPPYIKFYQVYIRSYQLM